MNIFHTNTNPYIAASHLCDKHVNKMLTETVQMLCMAHDRHDTWHEGLMFTNARHFNHPMTKWVAETQGNYIWTLEHAYALRNEYWLRYGFKPHKSAEYLKILPKCPAPLGSFRPPPLCMPKEYHDLDYTIAYRNYYIHEKNTKDWCRWEKGVSMPDWVSDA